MENCLEQGWSYSVLLYQLDTDLYTRQVKNIKHNNFQQTMKQNSDLANNMMKDPYIFDLVSLTKDYKEKELENKMVERVKNVLLELGNGFSFVGNQYKITVEDNDYFVDLLFYHIKLKCYVAVELKVVEFTLKYINRPVGVSEYKILDELPNYLLKKLTTKVDNLSSLEIEEMD